MKKQSFLHTNEELDLLSSNVKAELNKLFSIENRNLFLKVKEISDILNEIFNNIIRVLE